MTENSLHTPRAPRVRRLIMITAAIVLVGVAVLIIVVPFGPGADGTSESQSTSAETSTNPSPSVAPSPSAGRTTPGGSDASQRFGTPSRDLITTGELFLRGWIAKDPTEREALLSQSATPELAAELMLTAPENIPDDRVVRLKVTGQAAHSGEIRVTFASGDELMLYLAYDPVADHEWAVFSLEEW